MMRTRLLWITVIVGLAALPSAVRALTCPPSDATSCIGPVRPGGSHLTVKYGASASRKSRIKWIMNNADTTNAAQFGDPVNGLTEYAVCIYSDGALVYEGSVAPQGMCEDAVSCWTGNDRRVRFRDPSAFQDGVRRIKLSSGVEGRTLVKFKAANNIVTPTLNNALTPPPYGSIVTAEIHNDLGHCWEARFDNSLIPFYRNDLGQFRALSVGP